MTEWLHFHFSLSCIGDGNGNPLQCSCLENPRDGGAWWAAICGVTQSRTQLKRLSSSSSICITKSLCCTSETNTAWIRDQDVNISWKSIILLTIKRHFIKTEITLQIPKRSCHLLSCVQLLETPCTVPHQAPPSMGFSRQEYWSGVPLPSLI